MKRTSVILCVLALLFGGQLSAQENGNRDESGKIVRGPYETNRFFDNIFIGAGAGLNLYEGENDTWGDFGKRLSAALDIFVGKWVTPSVGLRLGYSGIKAKGWTRTGVYAKGYEGGGMFKEKFSLSYFHGDLMWNLSNAVSGYKETRTWNFIPFIGAGWARSYGNSTHKDEMAASIGLLNNIRLCDLVDLNLEARQMLVNQRFDGVTGGSKGEGMTSLTLGVTFKLNRRGFKRVQTAPVADCSQYLDQIKALESNNANLADKNKALTDENEELRNRQPEKVTETVRETGVTAAPVVLFFGLGKATLDKKELVNLDFYVNHAMKADENKVFTLIGSADAATGSAEVNRRLSEQRMQYVYDILVNKYGIPSNRLVKKAEGDSNNRFDDPELNRAVILE